MCIFLTGLIVVNYIDYLDKINSWVRILNMISDLFNSFIYQPLYNGLVLLIDIIPLADVGLAVVALTILVKLALSPLAYKASIMQHKIRSVNPQMEDIKKKYTNKQEQTLKILELYKKNKIKPFSNILVLFIQIPIIFGLYFVFYKGGLPDIDASLLYSFVSMPPTVPDMMFLGFFDMAGRSVVFALLAGVSQFFLTKFTLPAQAPKPENPTIKDDLIHSMHLQMKYVLPVIITVIAYTISTAVALYWATSNIFAFVQELLIRKIHKKT